MIIRCFVFIFLTFLVNKQGFVLQGVVNDGVDDSTSVHKVGTYPVFDGDINDFVKTHLTYPLQARMDSIEEIVYVRFDVDTLGKTHGHHVIWGKHPDLICEALRVSQLVSFKKPATQNGHPVQMSYVLPVDFRLLKDGSDDLILCLQNMPMYFRGSLRDVITSNLTYPRSAVLDSLEGTVYIAFVIDINGITKNHWVLRGVRFDLDQEALRVTRLIKFDKPAMQASGRPVSVLYFCPVKFSLAKVKTSSRDNIKR